MSHKNKQTLQYQAMEVMRSKTCLGRSKHEDKQAAAAQYDLLCALGQQPECSKQAYINNALRDKIYSSGTYATYAKHNNYFLQFCKDNYGCKTLDECRPHADEWLQGRIAQGLSAWTIKLEASALGKLYGEPTGNFTRTPSRQRRDITRGRGVAKRDGNFSQTNNRALIDFCKCTGLRRSELEHLRGNQLVVRNNQAYLRVKGKGGKVRMAPILNNNPDVIRRMRTAGDGLVWGRVNNNMDVHSYRADYATSIYTIYARPTADIPQADRYICRGDKAGMVLDRQAMQAASTALGHSRIDVVASHYIR